MNLLEEAKIRYPIGTVFSNKNLGYNCTNIKIRNSLLEEEFHKYLLNKNIKIISFDIFDTLVFRKVDYPKDIFKKMSFNKLIKEIFKNEVDFEQLRITAEKLARKESLEEEITLEDIYAQFKYLSKQQQKNLCNFELKIEQKYLFINHEIGNWIELALKYNKKVIFVSDMYLTKKQICQIILKDLKSLNKIDNIFVSSDLKKTKYFGTMYDYILKQYSITANEILHIGDNLLSDISSANNKNINTIYYNYDYMYSEQIKHEKLYSYCSSHTLTLRNLAVINNPYNDEKNRFFYNFGATIAAPILWSFSQWLVKICIRDNSFDIGFILREGSIFKKYFSMILKQKELQNRFNLKEINVSRKALFLPSITYENFNVDKINLEFYRDWKVIDFYNQRGLSITNNLINNIKNKSVEEIRNSENLIELIANNLSNNINQIMMNKNEQLELFLEYWKDLNMASNQFLFDFGANATMHKIISDLTKEKYTSVLFYRTKLGFENSFSQKQFTYIPYNEKNKYKIELLRRSPDIFEILFNGMLKTTLGYQKKGNKVLPLIDSYSTIEDKSIIKSFAKGINNYFNYSFKYNQKENIFNPDDILNIMTRVIEFPTTYEAKYLGELYINTSEDASKKIPLISTENKNKVKEIGIKQVLDNLKINLYKDWQHIPWVQGAITLIDHKVIKQNYIIQEDVNQAYLNNLLNKIDEKKISEVSIYGVGEFFLKLLPELLLRNIEIKYLIETMPSNKEFMQYKVLSPEEIALTNQKNFIIASVAFSSIMVSRLNSVIKNNIENIFYV
jgi:HAD superfamily hydrolase (TIGR01549 family)